MILWFKKNNLTLDLILVFVTLVLTGLVLFRPVLSFDVLITNNMQLITNIWFARLMYLVSFFGNSPYMEVCVALFAFLFWTKQKRNEALILAIATGVSAILGIVIKNIIQRPRPIGQSVEVFANLLDKSFPSNHVLTYTVFFGLLYYLFSQFPKGGIFILFIRLVSLLLIFLIGFSRIYLGVHWFSDVVAGYTLGILFLHSSIKIYSSLSKKNKHAVR